MNITSYRSILNDALALPKDKEMQAQDIYHNDEHLLWPKRSDKFMPSLFPKLNALVLLSGARIIHEQGKTPITSEMGARAHIRMPLPKDFVSPSAYGHVLLHELAHWTNHSGKLRRPWNFFKAREQEELTAELASYMLGDEFGITGMDQMALSYLKNYTEVLQFAAIFGDKTSDELFEEAFNEALKVVAWVHSLVGEPEPA